MNQFSYDLSTIQLDAGLIQSATQGLATLIWAGQLSSKASSIWQIGVVGTPFANAPAANGPEGAKMAVRFGQSAAVVADTAQGQMVHIPAGFVQVIVDTRFGSGADVTDLPSGTFNVVCVPAGSVSEMRSYVSFRTPVVAHGGDGFVDVVIPPWSDAVKIWNLNPNNVVTAYGVQKRAAAAPLSEGQYVQVPSTAAGFSAFPWLEVVSRDAFVRIVNLDPVVDVQYKALFRLKW